jgi:hypothetical protein
VKRGDIVVIARIDGGDEYGVDDRTPAPWRVGVITSVSRDGSTVRAWRDADGKTHRVNARDRYLTATAGISPYYLDANGVLAVAHADEIDGRSWTLTAVREWLRDVRHHPLHRAAVIRAAGF